MKFNYKYFLRGTYFGFFNEVFFAPLWDYDRLLGPMILDDVPILFIIGWGLMAMITLSIGNYFKKKVNVQLRIIDIVVITACCYPLEILFSRNGLINYNYWLHENLIGCLIGYLIT